jgi:hypothetical protein
MNRSSLYRKPPFPCAIDPNWWGWSKGVQFAFALNEGNGLGCKNLVGKRAGIADGLLIGAGTNITWVRNVLGRQGPHLSFNGTSPIARLNIDDASGTKLVHGGASSAQFSVSAWVYSNGFANQVFPTIVQVQSDEAATAGAWFLKFSNQSGYNGITWAAGGPSGGTTYKACYTNTTAKINQWVHVCIVCNGIGNAAASYTCYENGISLAVSLCPAVFGAATNENNIGAVNSTGSYFLWDGYIEQIQFFSGVLTINEVWKLYTEPWHWIVPAKKVLVPGVPILPIGVEPDPHIIYPVWSW